MENFLLYLKKSYLKWINEAPCYEYYATNGQNIIPLLFGLAPIILNTLFLNKL